MGRFTDPCSDQLAKEYREKEAKKQLALACLWKPKPEHKWRTDEAGRYFFDEEHYQKVVQAKGKRNLRLFVYRDQPENRELLGWMPPKQPMYACDVAIQISRGESGPVFTVVKNRYGSRGQKMNKDEFLQFIYENA